MCNGYYILSEIDNALKSGFYESPLENSKVDWSLEEVIKLE